MAKKSDRPRSKPAPVSTTPTAQELEGDIDSGRTADKVASFDPATSPLGTDDEAAGTPDTPTRVATALRQEVKPDLSGSSTGAAITSALHPPTPGPGRARPVSPNLQIYRPQLTSVLSIANRITGVVLSIGAVGLVVWLLAAASGPQAYGTVQSVVSSWTGQIVLFGFTFAFFLHLCGGIRHLVWDTVHGFELRSIYIGGWIVVATSVVLTLMAWGAGLLLGA